jgi:hypothetical protein
MATARPPRRDRAVTPSEAPLATTSTMAAAPEAVRRRLGVGAELALAAPPTAIVLVVLAFVDALSRQRLLFGSLASSAFLIYLDPRHPTNHVRTLVLAQACGALMGWLLFVALGPSYVGAGVALVATTAAMIALDAVHPPAVSTALGFALRSGDASSLAIFGLALGVTAALVVLQRSALLLLGRLEPRT